MQNFISITNDGRQPRINHIFEYGKISEGLRSKHGGEVRVHIFSDAQIVCKTILRLLCLLLMLKSRILGLISRGTAYFVVNTTATAIEERVAERGRPSFGAKFKSLETQSVQFFLFVNLICICNYIDPFSHSY